MLEFDLPHQFSLIFLASGGLGLFTSDNDIQATFERVMVHLKPGGVFIFEFEPLPHNNKYANDSIWGEWEGDWVKGSDNAIIAWWYRFKYNPTTHIWDSLFIVEKFISGSLVETETNERTGRYFTIDETVLYASSIGFDDIKATDLLTEDSPNDNSEVITVWCKKPALYFSTNRKRDSITTIYIVSIVDN